jgi:hypothetical protein
MYIFDFRICQQSQEKPMEKVDEQAIGMSEQEVIFLYHKFVVILYDK